MFITPLSQVNLGIAQEVGAKALSLNLLKGAGLHVPEAFVLRAETFSFFLSENGLMAEIESELSSMSTSDLASVEHSSYLVRNLVMGAPMPPQVEQELFQQAQQMAADFVAIRCSIYHDTQSICALTGELENFLHVDKYELVTHIKQAWASLFTMRPLYILMKHNINPCDTKFALVIQKSIDAEISGVIYTSNPVTEDENQVIIEANLGVVVRKHGNPMEGDTYVFNKKTGKIVSKHLGRQPTRRIFLEDGDTTIEDLSPNDAERQKLPDAKIKELVKIATEFESLSGHKGALEWLYDGGFTFVEYRDLTC